MASVRVFYKKQIRIDQMNFRQQSMFKIGTVGVAAVKNRLAAAQGPTDSSAKPLTKRYAIQKTKLGKGNRRNLMMTGDMLRNFQVRTVIGQQGEGQQLHAEGPAEGVAQPEDRAVGGVLPEEQGGGRGVCAPGAAGDEAEAHPGTGARR